MLVKSTKFSLSLLICGWPWEAGEMVVRNNVCRESYSAPIGLAYEKHVHSIPEQMGVLIQVSAM